MAAYAAQGAGVTLVTCTRGELGEIIPPELAYLAAGGGDPDRPPRHPVRLDVIGVAVVAVGVVGDDHLGRHLADHGGELRRRLAGVRPPEAAGKLIRRQAHHPGVPPPARAAEEPVVGHAERGAGGRQLAGTVLSQPVAAAGGQIRQLRRDDLTQLPAGAGDQRDAGALRGVGGHGRAGADRLVVRMGVNQQQPPGMASAVHTDEPTGRPAGRIGA